MAERAIRQTTDSAAILRLPGVDSRLTAEQALRAAIDSQVFSALRDLESLDGGRAVQAIYVTLIRRLPNVIPDRKRLAIDSGFSESSVKRAVKLLEQSGLIQVDRPKGQSSVYHITDIRSSDAASRCLSAIRKLARSAYSKVNDGRATSEPSCETGRTTCEPTARVTCEVEPGSVVNHKDTNKKQSKQQCAAAELEEVLQRWGLSSARYLVTPGHERAIPLLVDNVSNAGTLIEGTMRKVSWSKDAGVGARVSYLREHVSESLEDVGRESRVIITQQAKAEERAREVLASLVEHPTISTGTLDPAEFEVLFNRGLKRLGVDPDVVRVLSRADVSRRKVVSDELFRQELECVLRAMSKEEFRECREHLFSKQPGLRRLYGDATLESTGLRLRLIEFLRDSRNDGISAASALAVPRNFGSGSQAASGGEKGGGGGLEPAA